MLNPLEDSDWEPRPQKKRRAWPFLLVAVALGFAAYRSGGAQAKFNAMVDRFYTKEARGLIRQATAQAKALGGAEEARDSESAGSVDIEPSAEAAKVWRIRVNAYDLRALKPVKGLSVTLRGGGKTYPPRTKGGAFDFDVPRLEDGGYRLDVRRNGRPARYIEDIADVPYRDHDDARRARDIDDLAQQEILHTPVRAEDVSGKLELPIAVLP
ncbi:MAG: hypothetical protein HY553_22740 [Elusimicrobia bacterium]|nr:hypothetical protein [Elusimicrobiota bacterium]